ncbi:ABC-type oligopeptide transport system ATPase subunit [Elusimicrobium posterum]|uniref:ABC transporter ATP-binding protein n=1 Tax=Elusimicrobium posterum TaxID=3116653 RepID=UPI003C70FADB
MKNILEIKDLNVSYEKRGFFNFKPAENLVVKNFNLTVHKGGAVGLVGESGCGKTTVAKTVLGLKKQLSGSVLIDGRSLLGAGRSEARLIRRDVQAVFQDPFSSLDPRMTVKEIISEPFQIHGLYKSTLSRNKKIVELLNCVGLSSSYFYRYPHEFSGGQHQRIAIARALALNPKLLVLDEPTSALDVSVQAQVLNLLKEIKKDFNLSILFISHDIAAARFLCDEIVVMNKGEIVEKGKSERVLSNPHKPYTKTLLAAVPRIYTGGAK